MAELRIKPRRFLWAALGLLAIAAVGTAMPAAAAARHRSVREAEESGRASPAPPPVALNQIHVMGNRPAPFALQARAAMLVDARTGAMLYAFNEHQRMQPASLAKIMTFYLTLDALRRGALSLDTQVTVSEQAWRLSMDQSVSRMFLDVGQRVAVRDLLYGLMVSSGNDAAVALAEYIAGSSDAFVRMMNDKCRELGLAETHFLSPDGLPEPDQYTTAADMVKLARDLVERFPDALAYTSTKEFTSHKIAQRNFNTLLFYDSRVNGLKTGHVAEAGYHLVATASSHGMNLISAVMGAPSAEKRRLETEKLLDWAFRSFVTVTPDWHRAIPSELRVYAGASDRVAIAPATVSSLTVDRGQESKVSVTGALKAKYLVAPVAKGAQVGEISLMVGGQPQATVPVETGAAVAPGGLLHRIADRIRMML
ncbi:MAG: D-alanyl-D-alanine carboxypeptidase family protein [Candidatus Binataceae bacterium]